MNERRKYWCKCCGHDFSEEEGRKRFVSNPQYYDEITCPMCEAAYDEDENYIEAYNG